MKQEDLITTSQASVERQLLHFIIDVVQGYLAVGKNYHSRKTRKREIVFARQVAMYLIKRHTKKLSLKQIGKHFGDKDHATVLHGIKTIKNLMEFDRTIKNTVNEIDKVVKFKSNTVTSKLNLDKDYYYVDLSRFVSLKLMGQKSILLAGFNPEEVEEFAEAMKSVVELKEHENTGMYILEKREKDGDNTEED